MKEKQTEERIKQTAKRIFFGKGHFNAKMHEIAHEAGFNKALLHYYFRNRENLFDVVLREAMEDSFVKMFAILSHEKPFEEKIRGAIDHIIDCLAEYPFMENFIISEINKSDSVSNMSPIKPGKSFMKSFKLEIADYLKKNKITQISPEQFMVNMMALCAYASTTKPIIKNILGFSEKDYAQFLEERKRILPAIVLMKPLK